jgi:hypothetical protein
MMSTIPAAPPAAAPLPGADDRPWYIVGRWQEYEGEARANLLRLAAVAASYAVELINHYGIDLGAIHLPKVSDAAFHRTVTSGWAPWPAMRCACLASTNSSAGGIAPDGSPCDPGPRPAGAALPSPIACEPGASRFRRRRDSAGDSSTRPDFAERPAPAPQPG